ncbi:26S proteasome non-ATPase regulatory subunit 6 [Sciurus carolinensis]|uniref:26S proteasome non-ATPase regulatory subunit 6 n=1 Tax=Sciurus carolinensis TaxID=30640 RepID=A0AA41N094_SCICA|nr:26S proteasome non-ATPase regulatory subunit 6 [Sciurus carolinensis]
MLLENLEEEGLPKNPDLRIAQLRFLLSLPEPRGDTAMGEELMAAVGDNISSFALKPCSAEARPPFRPGRVAGVRMGPCSPHLQTLSFVQVVCKNRFLSRSGGRWVGDNRVDKGGQTPPLESQVTHSCIPLFGFQTWLLIMKPSANPHWNMDMDLLNKMKKANEEKLKRLDEELEDAEKNLGESEIWDAMMAKAEYLCRIGDKVSVLVSSPRGDCSALISSHSKT